MAHIFDNIKAYQEEIQKHTNSNVVKLTSSEEILLGDELFVCGICLNDYFVVVRYGTEIETCMAMDVLSSDIINQISFALRKRV